MKERRSVTKREKREAGRGDRRVEWEMKREGKRGFIICLKILLREYFSQILTWTS